MKVNPVTTAEPINKRKGNAMRRKETFREALLKQNSKEPLNVVIERKVDLYV